MPRTVTPAKGKHPHPDYLHAYVFERGGIWHTSVHHKRQTTSLPAKHKYLGEAMRLCSERIDDYKNRDKPDRVKRKTSRAAVTTLTAVKEFLQQKRRTVSPEVFSQYVKLFKQCFDKPMPLNDHRAIRTQLLDRFAKTTYANDTIRKRMQRLREYFDYCVASGLCDVNPLAAVKLPSRGTGSPLIPTADEVRRIIDYFRSGIWYERFRFEREQMALYVEFLSVSAIRPGEALKIARADVSDVGLKVDGKRHKFDVQRLRYIPFEAIAGLREITERVLNHGVGDYLFTWQHTQKPASNFRTAVTELGLNKGYKLKSLRAYAKNHWEKVLGVTFDMSNLLAGHSFAVRRHYVADAEMSDMLKYLSASTTKYKPESPLRAITKAKQLHLKSLSGAKDGA